MTDKVFLPHQTIPANYSWRTPRDVWMQFQEKIVCDNFTLDAAADDDNNLLDTYFTERDDALVQDWGEHIVWCNPPWGDAIPKWIAKWVDAAKRGAFVTGIVPASTNSDYWRRLVVPNADHVIFTTPRIQFIPDPAVVEAHKREGKKLNFSNRYDTALIQFYPGGSHYDDLLVSWFDWKIGEFVSR